MSENLSILDGELRRQFAPVDRLSVDNQGGGVSPWVVSDFMDISTLSVSENGLYLAAEEEYDCYEEVEVDISEELGEGDYRRITGKDPNLDPNNDYAAGLDENGNLTKEMIPSAIHIVVPPRKRKYLDGETINFDGIHVYLMDGNNHRYTDSNYPTGEIPFGELIFPVTIAEGGGGGNYHGHGSITGEEIYSTDFTASEGVYIGLNDNAYVSVWTQGATIRIARVGGNYIVASESAFPVVWFSNGLIDSTSVGTGYYPESYIYNGKTVYYNICHPPFRQEWENNQGLIPENDFPISGAKSIAWEMIYDSDASDNVIPVQWMRSDGEILEDTFSIEIVSEEEPVPEPEPDPWGGYADVSWGGHHYNINRRIVPQVHYANGYCWQEGTSEYTVEQAASMGWLILIR